MCIPSASGADALHNHIMCRLSNIKALLEQVTIDKFLPTAHIKALATAVYDGSLSFN